MDLLVGEPAVAGGYLDAGKLSFTDKLVDGLDAYHQHASHFFGLQQAGAAPAKRCVWCLVGNHLPLALTNSSRKSAGFWRPRVKKISTQGLGMEIRKADFHVGTFLAHPSETLEKYPHAIEI